LLWHSIDGSCLSTSCTTNCSDWNSTCTISLTIKRNLWLRTLRIKRPLSTRIPTYEGSIQKDEVYPHRTTHRNQTDHIRSRRKILWSHARSGLYWIKWRHVVARKSIDPRIKNIYFKFSYELSLKVKISRFECQSVRLFTRSWDGRRVFYLRLTSKYVKLIFRDQLWSNRNSPLRKRCGQLCLRVHILHLFC
jgi:hypothetical protein